MILKEITVLMMAMTLSQIQFNKKSSCQVKTYEEALKILWQVLLQNFAW